MFTLIFACFVKYPLSAQQWEWEKEGASFGIQFKPTIPNDIFRIRGESSTVDQVTFQLDPLVGFKAGAIIRFGIHPRFTLETGINYIRRPYLAKVSEGDNQQETRLRVIAYDIPLVATYYVRLSQVLYLNTAAGFHAHFLPSNLFAGDGDMSILAARRNWFTPSASARVGFEIRTRESGYFFIGPNYRFFFQSLYLTEVEFNSTQGNVSERFFLKGEYFGLLFRYVFAPGGN